MITGRHRQWDGEHTKMCLLMLFPVKAIRILLLNNTAFQLINHLIIF